MQFNNGFFEELGRSSGVENLVMSAAERVADKARSTAPVDTGAYKNSIKVEKKHQDRVVALVTAEDDNALIIESRFGTLARALRSTHG